MEELQKKLNKQTNKQKKLRVNVFITSCSGFVHRLIVMLEQVQAKGAITSASALFVLIYGFLLDCIQSCRSNKKSVV